MRASSSKACSSNTTRPARRRSRARFPRSSEARWAFNQREATMSTGTVVQVIGAVVDVEFPRDSIPKVYDALKIKDRNLTLEVQQQLGDGVVRTIAMGTSEGLRRGLAVDNTGQPIAVPVGPKTLGRIMNVLGDPI